jgi:hypothetical protein
MHNLDNQYQAQLDDGKKLTEFKHSLYRACKVLELNRSGNVFRSGRLVAFWCKHRSCIRAGFQACGWEKEALVNMFGEAVIAQEEA